ncbi:MAG: MFS transporter [Sulfolobus sp.]
MASLKTILFSSMIGNIIEWYDVFIFSTGAEYIAKAFLPPKITPTIALLDVFLVLALGFITRPVGALIFGNFGDRLGRKRMLITTLSITGVSSGLVGLLPTYSQIGIIAIVLLSLLRIILGVGLGGEWGGGLLLVAENVFKKDSFYIAFFQSGVSIGLVLGSLVFLGLNSVLPSTAMFDYGWRIAFILSFLLLMVGIFIRLKTNETYMFKQIEKKGEIIRTPLSVLFKKFKKNVIMGILLGGGLAIYFIGSVSIPNLYEFDKIVASTEYFIGILTFGLTDIFFVFLGGYLSNSLLKNILFIIVGNLLGILILYPAFLFKTPSLYILFEFLIGISHGVMYSPVALVLTRLFPTNVRYSGVSVVYQFAGAFIGGIEPYIIVYLSSINYLLYPVYQILLCIISIGIIVAIYKLNLLKYFEMEMRK